MIKLEFEYDKDFAKTYMDMIKSRHATYDIPMDMKIKYDKCDENCDTCWDEFKRTDIKDKNVYKFKTCVHKYCILCLGEWINDDKCYLCICE